MIFNKIYPLIIAILLIAPAFSAGSATISTSTTVCDNNPYVNISSFSKSPTPLYSDQLAMFNINLKNTGNCYTMSNVTLQLYINNSLGLNVWNVTRISSSGMLAGNSEVYSIIATYLPTGTYSASLIVSYTVVNGAGDPMLNNTANRTIYFPSELRPDHGGGGGGGGSSGISLPPSIKPINFVKIEKFPILHEVYPGENIILDLSLKNPQSSAKDITVNMTGLPETWLRMLSQEATIGAGESKTLSFNVEIPKDAQPGDYLVKAQVSDKSMQGYSYFIIRVKKYDLDYKAPVIYRRIYLDFVDNTTSVRLFVQNDAETRKRIDVYENVPKVLANHVSQIDFDKDPTQIIEADPLFMYSFDNMQPRELRDIKYTINNAITEYEPYVYWPIEQVSLINERNIDDIAINSMHQSIFAPNGKENEISFQMDNNGIKNQSVVITFQLPDGWTPGLDNFTVYMPPLSERKITTNVYLPSSVKEGSYIGSIIATYENTTVTKEVVFMVQNQMGLSGDIIDFEGNGGSIMMIIGAVLALAIMLIIIRRRKKGYKYKEDTDITLWQVKNSLRRR